MSAHRVGDIITKRDGTRWRVVCAYEGTLGLEPVGLLHRLYWARRLRSTRPLRRRRY